MCFTRPGIHEIKRAAEEIRRVVNYENIMYYKTNNVTESGISNKNGHGRISIYMHTFKGFLYRNSATEGWVLVNILEFFLFFLLHTFFFSNEFLKYMHFYYQMILKFNKPNFVIEWQ